MFTVADGTCWVDLDLPVAHAAALELRGVGRFEIDEHLAIRSAHKRRSKQVRNSFTDVVTACTRSRTDEGEYIVRIARALGDHAFQRTFDDAGSCPPPPGVNRRNCVLLLVEEEDRHTIGNADGEEDPLAGCDERVARFVCSRCIGVPHRRAVHLPRKSQLVQSDVQPRKKLLAIGTNVLFVISHVEGTVHAVGRCADTSLSRAHAEDDSIPGAETFSEQNRKLAHGRSGWSVEDGG